MRTPSRAQRVSRNARGLRRASARPRPPRPRARAAPTLAELTPRELANAEIADALVVSEHTTKTHVASVLSELALRNRMQAVVLAYESGLVTPGG
jgi:DNA-binding NarL/FixJ family response regulator